MKHEINFAVGNFHQRALPDAPLVMPRQVVERHFDWSGVFRLFALVRQRR